MQLKHAILGLIASFIAPVAYASAPAGAGACSVIDKFGNTLVFFQNSDTSITLRTGTGPASNNYNGFTVLSSGLAKVGTPLACVLADGTNAASVRLFYIGTTSSGLADQLHELVPVNGNPTVYTPGSLDGQQGTALPGTDYMYATLDPGNGALRLGFQCHAGQACEFIFVNNGWSFNLLNW